MSRCPDWPHRYPCGTCGGEGRIGSVGCRTCGGSGEQADRTPCRH